MRLRRVAAAFLILAAASALWPDPLWAWTPGTHVFLGQAILDNLHLLSPALAALLRSHPVEFLYGGIAPDTSFAKDYAPLHRHSHHWHLGQEVHDRADSDALRAFGYGYLIHLAADTVAHNYFVPRQLAATALLKGLGHAYWEARFESHLGDRWAREARELILHDHAEVDRHLDRIIAPTLFSVPTNRRLFRGMVHLADRTTYRRAFDLARQRSRYDIHDADVERHMAVSFEHAMHLLAAMEEGPRSLDPTGSAALRLAKQMRRQALREGGYAVPKLIWDAAEANFGLPRLGLGFWHRATTPHPWGDVALPSAPTE
ncbi:MAG: zinc dependent phospholipase C family protein [Gemmatimonadales bacterium]